MAGSKDRADQLRLGFLTAIETRERAFTGGLLVTDRCGRPLEFQCTTPVKPNRTQELLYGPTLVPFILGELLGRTLVEKISVKPTLLFTAREEMLALRPLIPVPLLLLPENGRQVESSQPVVTIGTQKFRLHPEFAGDQQVVSEFVGLISAGADMREPLERVTEALRETMDSVSAAKPRVA